METHLWKRPGARVMTIFGSHVGPHIPNTEYFEVYKYMRVYEGIWRYMEVYEGIWNSERPLKGSCL